MYIKTVWHLYKFDRLQLDGESVLIGGHDNGKNVCPYVLCQIGDRGISTVLSVTQIIQYKHYEILQLDWTSYEEISMQDPAKAALHGLRCQLALRRGRRSSARGLWESQAEGGWATGIWKTWANLRPIQITQVRLMKDEGGRLRGYGYADFEDRDSLVGWL